MPEYLAPGVYVEEVDTGSKPIEGVSTSTAGLIGVTERGPVDVPILVTSQGEFTRWFGERLNILDFSNALGAHSYLPHAVEGFFTNGGKRAYITRILPAEATRAELNLFDRGDATSASTLLLRPAAANTGSAVTPPLLYVLDPTNLAVNDVIRIGDGSRAEYHTVTAIGLPADNTHVPLSLPLSRAHDAGAAIDQIPRTVDAAYGAGFTLVEEADAGSSDIVVTGAGADVAILLGAAGQLLEIGAANGGEYRIAVEVTDLGGNQARVTLDSDLTLSHDAATAVTPLDLAAAVTQSAVLTLDARAGDSLVFVDDRQGDFDVETDLVVLEPGVAGGVEVRRIGQLGTLELVLGAYDAYPARSMVDHVDLVDDDRTVQALASAGDTVITLNDATALAPGQEVTIDDGTNTDTAIIDSVDTSNPAAPTITLRTPLANGYAVGVPVSPTPKHLTAEAAAGQMTLALDNRLGLAPGHVLRIGASPDEEFATIAAVTGQRTAAPDAGTVVLTRPLARDHANGAEVRRQNPPAAATGAQQSTLVTLETAAGGTRLLVGDGHGYAAGDFIRVTLPSGGSFYHRLAANAVAAAPVEVTLDAALLRTQEAGSPVAEREALIRVLALDAGSWGNRLRISAEDERSPLVSQARLSAVNNPTQIRLTTVTGVESGTVLQLYGPGILDPEEGDPVKVVSIDRAANNLINLAPPGLSAAQIAAHNAAAGAGQMLRVRSREFRITVYLLRQPDPAVPSRNESVLDSEQFLNLSLDPRHSRYLHKIIGTTWTPSPAQVDDDGNALRLEDRRSVGQSRYIRVRDLAQGLPEPQRTAALESVRPGPEALVDLLPNGQTRPARHAPTVLGNDSMATLTDATYIGVDSDDPDQRTGLHSLRSIEQISLVACPGRTSATIQQALIDHCENMRYRFAVLDGNPPPSDSLTDIQTQRQQFDTRYAALYHPWLLIPDPFAQNLARIAEFPIPPSGHMLGIYARTDIERGVHKAPANEVVRGIIGLQRTLSKGEQDILNPMPVNVNVVRDFRENNRGIRVFGARVITTDSDWKYVNVRRLVIFIEHSLDLGLQWVVFEPNEERLWARVRRAITNFLTVVWRNGALEGTKPEEAFYVKCDRTTMTQTDIDNGRLICLVGVAPVKPAEFVIIRIGLWTARAEV